jgi:heme-degrading monooxygenase HmoA
VARWRNLAGHRATQDRGRREIFDHYRLRVAAVVRDYDKFDRTAAPPDSVRVHDRQAT